MASIKLWTRQHHAVLDTLERTGRYTAKKRFVELENEDCAPIMLEAYNWLVRHAPGAEGRPPDAEYPIWASYSRARAMPRQDGRVLLELTLDAGLVTPVPVDKWGTILNYGYIPASPEDAGRHRALLEACRTSDTQAYLSQFYPDIKREIVSSWDRLFDDEIRLLNDDCYAIIWEIQMPWVTDVIR